MQNRRPSGRNRAGSEKSIFEKVMLYTAAAAVLLWKYVRKGARAVGKWFAMLLSSLKLRWKKADKKDLTLGVMRLGANTAGGVISLVLRTVCTVFLIILTTGVIFACIFVIYVKTNLSTGLDVTLEEFRINQTSMVYYEDTNGNYKLLTELQSDEHRVWVKYEDISPYTEYAAVAIEDKRFYNHDGVDWARTGSAFIHMFLGNSGSFGGSTITQQLLKNTTGDNGDTVQRKLREIFRALELEKNYTKSEIIEWYLNMVYFGHKCYGIEAAADYYFGKSSSDLTMAESACIVGITNNPSIYSPYISVEKNKERQETILNEMYRQGYISKDEYTEAINQELDFVDHTAVSSKEEDNTETKAKTGAYSWFVDALIEDVITDFMELKGCSYEVAEELLFCGGYTIYATIDPEIQEKVDYIYSDLTNFDAGTAAQLQSAIIITDPYTGDVVAMAGGVGEKTDSRIFNRATDANRSPGSSIKPLSVYAPAFEFGLITADTLIEDTADVRLENTSWMPRNSTRSYSGIITIREALKRSVNTVAAQLVDKMSPRMSFKFLTETLGFSSLTQSDVDYAPMSLGGLTYGVSPEEMASAYSIFVNNGVKTNTRTYTTILDSNGQLVYENEIDATVAISDKTAYWMTSMLQEVVTTGGTGTSAALANMHVAGKTGTTSDNYDRWFVGFTPYYCAAVWVGYDIPQAITWSGNPAPQFWRKVMSLVHDGLPDKDFFTPADTYLTPIKGVEPVNYTIRCILPNGEVIFEETKEAANGRVLSVDCKELEGYTLLSASPISLTVTKGSENIVTFAYTPIVTTPSEDPPTDIPGNVGGTEDPGNATVTDDPSLWFTP